MDSFDEANGGWNLKPHGDELDDGMWGWNCYEEAAYVLVIQEADIISFLD